MRFQLSAPSRSVGGLLADACRLLQDVWWDGRLGVRTLRGTEALGGGAKAGDPTSYQVLHAVARTLTPADVVYDVGCGRGRACVVFARSGARSIGIELSPEAASAARANGVEVRQGDARSADYDGATVLWLYNPFGPDWLRAVVRRAQAPRVIFYNASEEHRAVLFAEGYALVQRQTFLGLPDVLHYQRARTPWTSG